MFWDIAKCMDPRLGILYCSLSLSAKRQDDLPCEVHEIMQLGCARFWRGRHGNANELKALLSPCCRKSLGLLTQAIGFCWLR